MTSILSAAIELPARNRDYETEGYQRYPDPANLLPIPAEAHTFVHKIVNSALALN
jgi:hypothetical protein